MVFPYFLQFKSEFAIRSSWSEPQAAPGLVFAACIEFSIFRCKEYNQCDFGIDYLVMSMCRVISYVVGRGCLLWLVHSLGKTLLAFALLHFVLQHQTCLLFQVSLDFLLLHSSHLWWKGHLFRVLVLKGLVGLHRTFNFSSFSVTGWDGLGLLWYWMFCLGNEQRSFCRFWVCIQVLHFGLFCRPWWLLHFF